MARRRRYLGSQSRAHYKMAGRMAGRTLVPKCISHEYTCRCYVGICTFYLFTSLFAWDGWLDYKTVSFFSRFSVVLSLRYRCVTRQWVTHESREATLSTLRREETSLSSPTHSFHTRSRSYDSISAQKTDAKIPAVLPSNGWSAPSNCL